MFVGALAFTFFSNLTVGGSRLTSSHPACYLQDLHIASSSSAKPPLRRSMLSRRLLVSPASIPLRGGYFFRVQVVKERTPFIISGRRWIRTTVHYPLTLLSCLSPYSHPSIIIIHVHFCTPIFVTRPFSPLAVHPQVISLTPPPLYTSASRSRRWQTSAVSYSLDRAKTTCAPPHSRQSQSPAYDL